MDRPVTKVRRRIFSDKGETSGERAIPAEVAIALTYNGGSYAVMMATPDDLEDFAVGFSITEGIVALPTDIRSLEIAPETNGIELRMWLSEADAVRLNERRRYIAGPTGCGLCGIDSLEQAMRPAAQVSNRTRLNPVQIMQAVASIAPAPFTPPRSGIRSEACWRYAKTSGATTRWTSLPAHCCASASTAPAASWC
jgi:FdhD protein